MKAETRQEKGYLVVSMAGRLDTATSPKMEKQLITWIDEGNIRLILDFSKLDYISSAGLRVVLATAKKTRAASGSLALCALSDLVLEVFVISGFDAILPIHQNADQVFEGGA